MRNRAAAIIVKGSQILLIHRHKSGREYYVLPGGGIENGEKPEEALIREIKEETNFDAKLAKSLGSFRDREKGDEHYFFLVTEFSGEMRLGGPEAEHQSEGNKYILEWHSLSELDRLDVLPIETSKMLNEFLGVPK